MDQKLCALKCSQALFIIIIIISINVQTSKMSNVVHVYAIVAIIIVIKSNYNECDECKPSLNSCNVGASTICSGRLFQISGA